MTDHVCFSLYPSLFILCTAIVNIGHVWWLWNHRGAEQTAMVLSIIRCFQWCRIRRVCREGFSNNLKQFLDASDEHEGPKPCSSPWTCPAQRDVSVLLAAPMQAHVLMHMAFRLFHFVERQSICWSCTRHAGKYSLSCPVNPWPVLLDWESFPGAL